MRFFFVGQFCSADTRCRHDDCAFVCKYAHTPRQDGAAIRWHCTRACTYTHFHVGQTCLRVDARARFRSFAWKRKARCREICSLIAIVTPRNGLRWCRGRRTYGIRCVYGNLKIDMRSRNFSPVSFSLSGKWQRPHPEIVKMGEWIHNIQHSGLGVRHRIIVCTNIRLRLSTSQLGACVCIFINDHSECEISFSLRRTRAKRWAVWCVVCDDVIFHYIYANHFLTTV